MAGQTATEMLCIENITQTNCISTCLLCVLLNKKAQLSQGLCSVRHLDGNSAIRSANPKSPTLEPNMEWIGYTVCEIFAFKLYCDIETGVRGHSMSSKVALFDTEHTTLYSPSIVNMCLSITVSKIWLHVGRKLLPLVFGIPIRGEAVRFTQQTLVTKN